MNKPYHRILLALFSFCCLPAAFAQDQPVESGATLEEVLVTAQKREESLQDVAITIQAYTGEQIAAAGLMSTDDLGQIVTGYLPARQITAAVPYLRGVGTQNGAMGDEASIPQYIDGVYMASIYGNVAYFNNIARVEVLKGPQGTLYGRNATGGLVSIITVDPSQETSGKIGMTYGNYDTVNTNLYATTGVGENIAADIAITYLNQGKGYGKNLYTGGETNFMDNTSMRSKWIWTPNDDTKFTFIADYANYTGSTATDRSFAEGTYGIDGALYYGGCLAAGGSPADCQAFALANATKNEGFQNISANFLNLGDSRQWGVSGRLDYSLEGMDFVSITAYRDMNNRTFLDQDATPLAIVDATLPRQESQFSQEFQLLSNTDSKLSWIVGLFYLNFKPKYTPFQLDGDYLFLLAPGLQSLDLPVSQFTKSFAVFGEMTYDFNDQWALTLGGRYTWDKRTVEGQTDFTFATFDLSVPFSGKKKWDEPTWKVSLDYKPNDDLLLYGTYSRGFKSGVFNTVVTSGVLAPPVEPETLDAYEVGFKSYLANGAVRLNGAAFYYDYTDLQLVSIDAGITFIRNATSADVLGAEMEMAWAVTDNLEVNAGAAWLDTEYGDFACVKTVPSPVGGGITSPSNCKGNDLIRAPKFTGNIGSTYTVPIESGSISASFNWYFNGGFYWEPDNQLKQDSYNVLNAEVSWMNAAETMKIKLFGANLTDSEYSWYSNSGQFGYQVSAAPPLTWGAGVEFYW